MKIEDQLRDLLKIADSVNHSSHMEESFGNCVELAKDMFSCPCVAVIMVDETTEDLFIRTARGLGHLYIKEFHRAMGKEMMAEVIRALQPILFNDITPDSKFYADLKLEHDYSSVIVAPISYDQHAAGILYACHSEKNHFSLEDRSLFAMLAHILGFAVQKERLLTSIRRLATTDSKANVLTYTYFRDRAQQEILRSREYQFDVSLMLFDIDHYKRYRETHGEKAGEDLYRNIADRISKELSHADLIGRHGLDEIIVCKSYCNSQQAHQVAQKISQDINQQLFEKSSRITLSVGIVSLGPGHNDLISLINSVRIALLKAQRGGGNQISIAVE